MILSTYHFSDLDFFFFFGKIISFYVQVLHNKCVNELVTYLYMPPILTTRTKHWYNNKSIDNVEFMN